VAEDAVDVAGRQSAQRGDLAFRQALARGEPDLRVARGGEGAQRRLSSVDLSGR